MSMDQILDTARAFDGALIVQPVPGDGTPDIAHGDAFLYFAPDGVMPQVTQPYATIVTKDYPDDTRSQLGNGRWRVNIRVSREVFEELTSETPRTLSTERDFAATDEWMPHPVYGAQGWLCVVLPAARTTPRVLELLADAHSAARRRAQRR